MEHSCEYHVEVRKPTAWCHSGQDHKDFHNDIEAFPYRIYHGNVDVRILHRLKDCRLAKQVSLCEALSVQKAEALEVSFYRDTSYAFEVSKITGDLIALLLGVSVAHVFRADMTLLHFVEARFPLVQVLCEIKEPSKREVEL